MFTCHFCKKASEPNTHCTKVVTETRQRLYPERHDTPDKGGTGREIVKEVNACDACAKSKTNTPVTFVPYFHGENSSFPPARF